MSFREGGKELQRLIQKYRDAGHGKASGKMALEEYKGILIARSREPVKPKPNRHYVRTGLISFVFGAIWQGSRRRK
jgi:hypothetical protein